MFVSSSEIFDANIYFRYIWIERIRVCHIIKRFELDVPDDVRDKLTKDIKAPEKLRSTKQVEMFFAAKYTDEGTIEKLQDKESYLFSY